MKREIVSQMRDFRAIFWLLFLLGLWLLQASTNRYLATTISRHAVSIEQVLNILFAFQLLVSVYFSAAISLRFAFPSFSLEGKAAWITGTAPIDMRTVFWAKQRVYVAVLAVASLLAATANGYFLGLSALDLTAYFWVVVLSASAVASVAVSLGAKFPTFNTDDPQVISTSLPGLFLTATAVVFGSLCALLFHSYLRTGSFMPLVLLTFLSLAISVPAARKAAALKVPELSSYINS